MIFMQEKIYRKFKIIIKKIKTNKLIKFKLKLIKRIFRQYYNLILKNYNKIKIKN